MVFAVAVYGGWEGVSYWNPLKSFKFKAFYSAEGALDSYETCFHFKGDCSNPQNCRQRAAEGGGPYDPL